MKKTMTVSRLVKSVEAMKNVQFVSLLYKTKAYKPGEEGDLCRFVIHLGANYLALLGKSIAQLREDILKYKGNKLKGAEMLLKTLRKSARAQKQRTCNPDYTKGHIYKYLCKGIKVNINDRTLEICGLIHTRTVIKKGNKTYWVSTNPIIRAKYDIQRKLPVGKFHTFAIDLGHLYEMKINGDTLVLTTDLEG